VTGIITLLMTIAALDFDLDREHAYRLAGAATALESASGSGLSRLVAEIPGFSLVVSSPTDPTDLPAWVAGMSLSADEAVAEALGTRPPS